jgi:heme/copper-type cytochrome/quinol oxidase subunit 4
MFVGFRGFCIFDKNIKTHGTLKSQVFGYLQGVALLTLPFFYYIWEETPQARRFSIIHTTAFILIGDCADCK